MLVISPYFTFPAISWWLQTVHADTVLFDIHEHFAKMSYRNRYRISGSNNSILLTVPLVNGRDQRTPITEVAIKNEMNWQVQHWRTIVSVYNRSPYFFHYENSLKQLYTQPFTHLTAFNKAAMEWLLQQLNFKISITESTEYIKAYPDADIDLRHHKTYNTPIPKYYQVFEDRVGFVPDLSILDLLFSEGPYTKEWLLRNAIS